MALVHTFLVMIFACIIPLDGLLVRNSAASIDATNAAAPEQVHLSWDGDATHMTVTWSTNQPTETYVKYGQKPGKLDLINTGYEREFISGHKKRLQYIHRAMMKNLHPRVTYYYRVGNGVAWSDIFEFRSLQSGTNWSPRLAIFGDMGLENPQSLVRLRTTVREDQVDMIIHVGDFAYDMNDDEGRVGDAFLRLIEPLAAYVPYQTVVGNHENYGNFTDYKNRFNMPGTENGLFYRFTIGPANFVVFSTEFYFFLEYGIWQIPRQYSWLEKEFVALNSFAGRNSTPWIITLGHRPMYCSNDDRDDCTKHESIIRTGLPLLHLWPLEKLFYRYGIDLCIWAHEHSYERLWPVYNRKIYNGSNPPNPYHNPGAPVHIISGSAGCKEKHDGFINPEPWSAFRNSDYGFMKMDIVNKSHIFMEQISDGQGGVSIDSLWLVKTYHGSYNYKKGKH